MELRTIDISLLKPAAYNPRTMLEPGDPEFEKLKRSILEFSDVEPIVWNERTGNVVGGHQRLAVMKHLGRREATVSVVDLPLEEEKLLNVTLNKVKGTWDRDKLDDLLKEFEPEDALLTGFDANELAIMLQDDGDLGGWEDDFEDDEEEEEEDGGDDGMSWTVTLVFQSSYIAQLWAAENGFAKAIKDGAKSTVIRMK